MRKMTRSIVAFVMLIALVTVTGQGIAHASVSTICGTNGTVYYNINRSVEQSIARIRIAPECSAGTHWTGIAINGSDGNPADFYPNPTSTYPGWDLQIVASNGNASGTFYIGANGGIATSGGNCAYYCITVPSAETHYTVEIYPNLYPNRPAYINRFDTYTQDSIDSVIHLSNQDAVGVYQDTYGAHAYPWQTGDPAHESLLTGWSFYHCTTAISGRAYGASLNNPTRSQAVGSPANSAWFVNVAGTIACGTAKTTHVATVDGYIEAVCVDRNQYLNGSGAWYLLDCVHTPPSYSFPDSDGHYEGAWQGDFHSNESYFVPDVVVSGVHQPAYATRTRVLWKNVSDGALHWTMSA